MRTIIRRWRSIVTISSLVVYVLSFAIPVALPRIAKAELEVVYNLGGYVYINGQPAWNGFGVKVVVNGAARWATVGSGGWYEFRDGNALPPGAYAIQHNHGCPSNAPLQVTVPAHNNRAPNLNINCPTHTLAGYVYINGRPAWKGFGVKANLGSLETEWAVVENDSGWYQFRDGGALIAGTWTIGHNHNCPSNMPVQWGIPAPNNRGPDLQINCPSYPLHGYVYVNGKPAWEKFGVKAVLSDGTEKWALTDTNGWYDFKDSNALIAGNYTISHNHNCPSNAPIAISIPASNNKGPDIHINCPTYTLTGNVYVDGRPAWIGFGVKAVLRDGTEKWALVENSQGFYQFKDANRLIAGEYTIGHNHNCPSNMPVQWSVPASGDRGPNVEITCPTHTLNGHVHINGTPAWIGFGVKAVAADGSEKWALVENNQGWYQFKDANRLAAGSYTIHHNHNCPSTTPVSINIPATDNRGPDINITCPTHSLSGTVYVDGKPAWEKFGVKAVKDGKVTWALTDGNGYYSFQNLEPGTYSVGHVHPCTTDGGNPITVNMDGNKTADFRITCVSEPSPTPAPPNPFPYVCGDGGGVRYRDFGLYESPEYLIYQGAGYKITSVVKFDLEGTACPEDRYQVGSPESDVGLQLHGKYYDVTMSKRGKLSTNLALDGTISPEFSCGDMIEEIYMQKYVGSCRVGYNLAGYVPGSDIEVTGSYYIQFNFYLDGDQIGLKFAIAMGDIKNIVAQMDFQTATQTFVLIGSLTLFGIVQKYFLSITLLFPYLNIPDPGPAAASVASASLSNLTDEVQMTMGSYFATNSSLRGLDAEWQTETAIKLHSAGFRPSGHAYLLVMKVGALSEGETALVEQVVAADASGVVDMVVDLPNVDTSVLVLLVDMENFATEFNAYLKQTIPDITFTGAVGVVHPRGGESTSVYLPLIER